MINTKLVRKDRTDYVIKESTSTITFSLPDVLGDTVLTAVVYFTDWDGYDVEIKGIPEDKEDEFEDWCDTDDNYDELREWLIERDREVA